MSSSILFLALITLVLLLIFPSSTAYVVDTDGDPIHNGREYYIVPITSKGGLTYTQKDGRCPLYITTNNNSRGTPVTISTHHIIPIIFPNHQISLAFKGPTPCDKFMMWTGTRDPLSLMAYITTGSEVESINSSMSFAITNKRNKSNKPHTYELKYWSSKEHKAYNVGLFEDDGLLGLTNNPTAVSFKKAFDHLELSAS